MEWHEIIEELNIKINDFIQKEKRKPSLIVMSDTLLNILQKQHIEDNFLEYNGIEIRSTIRHKILGVF
jgi:hypothetical protein